MQISVITRTPLHHHRPVPTDRRVIAVYPICNFGGIEVLGVNTYEERVEIAVNNGESRDYRGCYKLYATKTGRSFFRMGGLAYYLDQFLKV
mgnify:CR=1 FL=1